LFWLPATWATSLRPPFFFVLVADEERPEDAKQGTIGCHWLTSKWKLGAFCPASLKP